MNTTVIAIIVIAAVVVIGAAVWMFMQKRRTEHLRTRFGPEYDRITESDRDRRHAEAALLEREKRVAKLEIVPLSIQDRNRFARAWQNEQARFVDDPRRAVANADRLISELMTARGYPMADFDRRAEDISVHHASVVENYRAAHDIALSDAQGRASTEDLRKALLHYRMLFEELLQDEIARAAEVRR